MTEHTPTEANTWEGGAGLVLPDEAGLAAAFARGICATPADKDAYSKSLDIARRGIEEIKAEVRADERAKRPDREQIAEALYRHDHRTVPGSAVWIMATDERREEYRQRADAVLSSLALEPEAREEPKHGLIEDYTAVQAPDWTKVSGKLEAREVTDAEQCMLVISASWDTTGHQPLPRYVGPFPDRDAAFSWVRHHAPLSGEFNSSPWPVRPEAVSRG